MILANGGGKTYLKNEVIRGRKHKVKVSNETSDINSKRVFH